METIAETPDARVILLFGISEPRVGKLIDFMKPLNATIYGVVTEAAGMERLNALPRVDLVIMAALYTPEQMDRIKRRASEKFPEVKFWEGSFAKSFSDDSLLSDIKKELA